MPAYVITNRGRPQRRGKAVAEVSAILGMAYKKDVDDPRESPSFELMDHLLKRGTKSATTIRTFQPAANEARPHLEPLMSQPLTRNTSRRDCCWCHRPHCTTTASSLSTPTRDRHPNDQRTAGREKIDAGLKSAGWKV